MPRGRTTNALVRRYEVGSGEARRQPDQLIVEEPLEVRLDGTLVATTMRTPGHDYELAAGWCLTEGLLGGAEVRTVKYCATGSAVDTGFNVVSVDTGGRAPEPTPRLGTTSSSCGWCGGSIELDQLRGRLPQVLAEPFDRAVLAAVPERVRPLQELFEATGGVHAAAAVDRSGAPVLVREDIGRHNAVDKVVGRMLLDGQLPAIDLALFVSGRVSFEIVQKAWAAGFGTIVAVSAVSSLAVDAARAAGITLAGFARPGRLNLYVEHDRAAAPTVPSPS